ncbi:PDGLE domain-containing protein [Cytobacillus sp. FJAT-54145]|uniref:PDGLE domain-containing protein n=1 Tax=Cytobacillus spartinae TaxID=3299023 RepID=A0ABW6K7F8_9BACI
MNKRLLYFLVATIILAVFISPLASSDPDGLERVAHDLNFLTYEKEPLYHVFSDYSVPFLSNEIIGTSLSGLIGIGIIGLLTYFGKKLVKRKQMIKE